MGSFLAVSPGTLLQSISLIFWRYHGRETQPPKKLYPERGWVSLPWYLPGKGGSLACRGAKGCQELEGDPWPCLSCSAPSWPPDMVSQRHRCGLRHQHSSHISIGRLRVFERKEVRLRAFMLLPVISLVSVNNLLYE